MRATFLRGFLVVEVVLLIVLFMLGQFISFFEIPVKISFGVYSYAGVGLEVHHFIAVLSIILGLLAILFTSKTKNTRLIALSTAGLVLLGGAFASGLAFVFLQENKLYSLAMAACFIAATIAYLSAVFSVKE